MEQDPRFECEKHGRFQRVYIACLCVLKFQKEVARLRPPTAGLNGSMLCDKARHEKFELAPYCQQCAMEQGLVKKGAKLV